LKEVQHWETILYISYDTFLTISPLCKFPQCKSCILNCTVYSQTKNSMLHFALYISHGQQIKLDHLQRGYNVLYSQW